MFARAVFPRVARRRTDCGAKRRAVRARVVSEGLERLEGRALLSLSPVSATGAKFPFTAIGKLSITFPNNRTFNGSGVMVSRFHVLTAGHNVYSSTNGGWAKSIRFTPLLDGTRAPYGSANMTYQRTYNSFINYERANPRKTSRDVNDIALLTLDRTLGDRTGWMAYGYDNNNGRFASGTIMNTAGYPSAGGYTGTKMQFSSGAIRGLSSSGRALEYLQSRITTYAGQSGSPVWLYETGTGARTIYGVHVSGTGTSTSVNFATRITQSIFNDLGRWRNEDATPTRSASVRATANQVNYAAMPDSYHGAVVLQATTRGLVEVTPRKAA